MMRRAKLSEMLGGWFIGDFRPSFVRTKAFEVAYKTHKEGEHWDAHKQQKVTEINLLIRGRLKDRGVVFEAGDLWEIKPGEISAPEFLEDCAVVCVKMPSVPTDKVVML